MKRNLTCTLLGWAMAASAATCGGHGDRATMLVTTGWLAEHLKDKNLVIVAIGPRRIIRRTFPARCLSP